MTAPSQYVRQRREEGARRRLEIAKLLRDDPATTNKQLAEVMNVNRNTITQDRKIIMEDLKNKTLTETELLRQEMVGRLEMLNGELELHRRDGKLSTKVIHEMLLVHRSIIELLGIRKPIVEKLEVRKTSVKFETSIIGPDGVTQPKTFEMVRKQLTLEAGDDADN